MGEQGAGRRIVLGVSGGIAAYKACEVVRRLKEHGHDVLVVPTANALEFVGRTTWEALSGHPVQTSVFADVDEVRHVRIGTEADLVVIVPATADLLSRAAIGRADDLLTNVLLTATCPKLMFPAMHTQMWQHPATVANVATLRTYGVAVMDPAIGRLTGPDSGPGRLPEPAEIVDVIRTALDDPGLVAAAAGRDLAGLRIAISTGGTHEQLDPVRFVGNSSSGRMGVALARMAALRGAQVTLVAAHITADVPSNVEVERVSSTGDLADTMARIGADQDVIIMAAAPADFRPQQVSERKIKKQADGGLTLDLVQTTDVLATLGEDRRAGQTLVGFAAETASDPDELLGLGRAKLARKKADLLVVNDVSAGKVFGEDSNQVAIIDAERVVDRVSASKSVVAQHILDAILANRTQK